MRKHQKANKQKSFMVDQKMNEIPLRSFRYTLLVCSKKSERKSKSIMKLVRTTIAYK